MKKRIRNLHRTLGAITVLFLLILAITGLLLNHTTDFKLDQRYITWPWVLEHYGLDSVQADVSYQLGQTTVSQFDDQLFVDAQPVYRFNQTILGAIHNDDLLILAAPNSLLLFTLEGAFIEQMGEEAGIPSQIQNIGLYHGDPVVQTRDGMRRADFMLEQWEYITLPAVSWSQNKDLPEDIDQQLAAYFYGKGISVERLVLDIHNGHIVDKYGVWLLDIIAILLVLLSLTGLYLWFKHHIKKIKNKLKKRKKTPLDQL